MLESNGASTFGDFEVLQKPWFDFDKSSILEELMLNELWGASIYSGLMRKSLIETSFFRKSPLKASLLKVVNFNWSKI